jgi:hypothetical protein
VASHIDKPFLDPQKRVDAMVADLARRVRYDGLVTHTGIEAFKGTTDDNGIPTLWWETDAATVARDYEFMQRTRPIQFDDIFRTKIPVRVDQHMTQGVRTLPEQEFFDEIKYGTDVTPVASQAVADKLSAKIETAFINKYANADTSLKITDLSIDANDPNLPGQLLRMKKVADSNGMPRLGRLLVAGANAYVHIATSQAMKDYDLQAAATLWRTGVAGMLVGGAELVDGGDLLDDNEFALVHPSWAVMPTGAGSLPLDGQGVEWARKSSVDGYEIRLQKGYSLDYDQGGQVIHTYWKINSVDDEIERHTRESAETANDGSERGDPVITDNALNLTGKSVRFMKGAFVEETG